MDQLIAQLVADLQRLQQMLPQVGDLEARAGAARADLDASNQQLTSVNDQLKSAQSGLSAAQLVNQKKHEEDIYAKQTELQGLAKKTADAQTALGQIEGKVRAAKAEYDNVIAGLNALREKHFKTL